MRHLVRPILWLPFALALPLSAQADAQLVKGAGSASATLNFRLVIPPIVRVLANQHPMSVSLTEATARQELEVLTTMRQGFCASLRLGVSGVRDWDVRAVGGGAQVLRTADGYRVCAPRNGRYQVALQHRFEFETATTPGEMPWPVQTDLSAL